MKEYRVDRRAITTLQIVTPILTGIFIGMVWYFLAILPDWLLWTLTIVLIVAAAVLTVFWIPMWLRSITYTISDTHMTKKVGVFFVREQTMRTQAVQFTTIYRMPGSARTGMHIIPVYAYGGAIYFAFLSKQDADEIQAFLHRNVYRRKEAAASQDVRGERK